MLVLNRLIGESIVIGNDIRLQVISVRGKIVRIGVTAPPDITISRLEVCERILQERASTDLDPTSRKR